MTIERDKNEWKIFCDLCYEFERGFNDFDEVRKWAKENGWEAKNINGTWINYCQSCAGEGEE